MRSVLRPSVARARALMRHHCRAQVLEGSRRRAPALHALLPPCLPSCARRLARDRRGPLRRCLSGRQGSGLCPRSPAGRFLELCRGRSRRLLAGTLVAPPLPLLACAPSPPRNVSQGRTPLPPRRSRALMVALHIGCRLLVLLSGRLAKLYGEAQVHAREKRRVSKLAGRLVSWRARLRGHMQSGRGVIGLLARVRCWPPGQWAGRARQIKRTGGHGARGGGQHALRWSVTAPERRPRRCLVQRVGPATCARNAIGSGAPCLPAHDKQS